MLESRSGAAAALLRTSVAAFAHHSPAAYDITSEGFEPHITGVGFGIPSSPGKQMLERLTLAEGGPQLRYELTIEDPEYLTAPGTYRALWDHRPDLEPSGMARDTSIADRFRDQ